MTTTRTSDTDLAIGRDLFPGEAMAWARAGIFEAEEDLKRLVLVRHNDRDALPATLAATKAGRSLNDLSRELSKLWRDPLREHGAVERSYEDLLRESLEDLLREHETVGSSQPRTEDLDLVRRNLRITGKEIRIMAGARFSSALNSWRNGKMGFPEPVVGGRSPLFDLTEVHAWLMDHDRLVNEPGADWYWRKWVQGLYESVEQGGRFLRCYVTAMVFVLPDFQTDKDGWVDRFHRIHTAEGFDQWNAGKEIPEDLAEFLQKHLLGVEFKDSESLTKTSTARAFWHAHSQGFIERDLLDQALDTLSELTDTQDTTSLPLSDLITRLVADLPGPPSSFLDLASGEATVLTSLASRGGLPDLQLSGFELDSDVAAISKIRLGYHENEAAGEIHVRDSLAEGDSRPRGAFDAVLVDPPTKKLPRWINRATALLNKTTDSRAFILLPEAALLADGPCAGSIKRKQLEVAVLLPNRLKRKSRGLLLCVFTSEQTTCDEIHVIDLKRKDPAGETGAKPARNAGDVLPTDDVCAAISHWRDTQTINKELLPGRQWSIRSSEATELGIGSVIPPADLEALLSTADLFELFTSSPAPRSQPALQPSKRRSTRRERRNAARLTNHEAGTNAPPPPDSPSPLPPPPPRPVDAGPAFVAAREAEERLEDLRRAVTNLQRLLEPRMGKAKVAGLIAELVATELAAEGS